VWKKIIIDELETKAYPENWKFSLHNLKQAETLSTFLSDKLKKSIYQIIYEIFLQS